VPFTHSSDNHPQVALDEFWNDKVTFPPFTPNRILRQQWYSLASGKKRRRTPHPRRLRSSSANLHRRVADYANAALFVWFSSGTKFNDRGCVMVYRVLDEEVSAWYASFRKNKTWMLDRTKEISRGEMEAIIG
jgi:hypothetical protein